MTTPFKWGAEFLVNTTTANEQTLPAITALADGRFVVSWQDLSLTGGDIYRVAIRGQVFNADGSPAGAEFPVSTVSQTTGFYFPPAITALANGRFVVSWTDGSHLGGVFFSYDIRAQMFNADGSPFGSEFLVNTTTTGNQYDPEITAFADGRFAVLWADFNSEGMTWLIQMQVFNADGSASGSEFLVNARSHGHTAITELANGRFVVSWMTERWDIQAQVFNADGSPFGSEFKVNTTTGADQEDPVIAPLADGGFVVCWSDNDGNFGDTSDAVRARVFNADGAPSGSVFLVNTTTTGSQSDPTITELADGRFVVSWTDASQTGGNTSGFAIRAQVFNADGTTSGSEFLVNTTTSSDQNYSTITALADGRFVISWQDGSETGDDTSGFAIRAQIFDPREAAVTLNGTLADDRFFGTIFADRLAGFFGNDTLSGAAGDDRLHGEVGNDMLRGGQGNDRAYGGEGHDVVRGGRGSDGLDGGSGNDTLKGHAGADALFGGTGHDILRGGLGQDRLSGGSGADRFIFASATEAGTGASRDRIVDFAAGSDTLDFTGFMAGGQFIGGAAFTPGYGPQVRFATATGILSGDMDGNGTVDFQLKLDGAPGLSAADFLF